MATSWRVRRQTCTHCGEKVVFVETKLSGLGGLWRRVEPTLIQHADFAPGHGRVDRVDADCRRPAAPDPDEG